MSGLGVVGSQVTVQIDLSGTAYGGTPTWTDVTSYVLTKDQGSPISITWGRQDWTSDIGASSCSFQLNNLDGRFTPGLTSGPYYPNVKRRARCRVSCGVPIPAGGLTFTDNGDGTLTVTGPAGFSVDRGDQTYLFTVGGFVDNGDGTLSYTGSTVTTTVYLFDGLIDSWETTYQSNGKFSVTAVTATDMLGRYGSDLPLRPMLYEEILKDLGVGNTGAMFTFADAGPTLGDIRNVYPPLTTYQGSGAPAIAYQNATGSADPGVVGVGLGGFFSYVGGHGFAVSSGMAVEMFFVTSFTGASAVLFGDNDDHLSIGINTSGYVTDGTNTGPFVADGVVHQLVYEFGVGWYLDGVKHGTVGIDTVDYLAFNLVGTVFCFTIYDTAPSLSRFAAHLTCARTGFAGESTDTHIGRLLGYRTTFGSVLDAGKGTVGVHSTDGETLQQALFDTVDAEGSVLFADGQGRVVFRNRAHLFNPPVALALDAAGGEIDSTTVFRDDIQFLVNRVVVTPPSGATQQYQDDTSISNDGVAEQNITLIVATDTQALARAKWEVQVGTQEQISATQLDCNLFTIPDANTVASILQTQPLDVVSLADLTGPVPSTEQFMVQGGSLSISVDDFLASLFTTVVPAGSVY